MNKEIRKILPSIAQEITKHILYKKEQKRENNT
jgi:hypothetical protein